MFVFIVDIFPNKPVFGEILRYCLFLEFSFCMDDQRFCDKSWTVHDLKGKHYYGSADLLRKCGRIRAFRLI